MIKTIIFVVLFVVLAIVFAMGKGDMLIAGYNTASEEERRTVNIHRLRILMAIICVITAVYSGVLGFIGEDMVNGMIATIIFIVITIVFVIFANTWAKKK